MNIETTRLVAGREIREQGRSKALWISSVVSVIAVVLLIVLPALLKGGGTSYRVAVAGPMTPAVSNAIGSAAQEVGVHVQVSTVGDRNQATAALAATGSTKADLAVIIGPHPSVLVDQASPQGATDQKALFDGAVARSVGAAEAVQGSGLPLAQAQALTSPASLPLDHLRPPPASVGSRATALVVSVLLFLLVARWGYGLLVGIVQEKSTRVIEIILPSVRPTELLAGKVAGYSALVLGQAAALGLAALVAAEATGSSILAHSGVATIGVGFVWIVLGFLFYAALYAAAGSLVSRTEDAQSVGFPLQIPLMVGYLASFTALHSGAASPLVKVLAYLPPTAPLDMPVLYASGGASPLGVVVAMVITVAGIVVAMRIGATIFSRSILRTGKRLKLTEVLGGSRSSPRARATSGRPGRRADRPHPGTRGSELHRPGRA